VRRLGGDGIPMIIVLDAKAGAWRGETGACSKDQPHRSILAFAVHD